MKRAFVIYARRQLPKDATFKNFRYAAICASLQGMQRARARAYICVSTQWSCVRVRLHVRVFVPDISINICIMCVCPFLCVCPLLFLRYSNVTEYIHKFIILVQRHWFRNNHKQKRSHAHGSTATSTRAAFTHPCGLHQTLATR